jgi:hypothetical protein
MAPTCADSAFRVRCDVQALECRPGRIKGYRLRFNLDGRPRGKAAPANLHPDLEAELWGVLYRITRRDLLRLDSKGRGYRHIAAYRVMARPPSPVSTLSPLGDPEFAGNGKVSTATLARATRRLTVLTNTTISATRRARECSCQSEAHSNAPKSRRCVRTSTNRMRSKADAYSMTRARVGSSLPRARAIKCGPE